MAHSGTGLLFWFLPFTLLFSALLQFEASPKHKTKTSPERGIKFLAFFASMTTSHCLHALSSALKQHFLEYKIVWQKRSAIVGGYLRSRNVALDSLRKKQKDRHHGFFFVNKTSLREIAIVDSSLWTRPGRGRSPSSSGQSCYTTTMATSFF